MSNLEHGSNRYEKKVATTNGVAINIPIAEAAKMMNVSLMSVTRAKKRMHQDPEAHAAIKAGHKAPKAPDATPSARPGRSG